MRVVLEQVDCGQSMLERQIHDLLPANVEQRSTDENDGTDPLAGQRDERAVDVVGTPNVDDFERHIEFSRGVRELHEATSRIYLPENTDAGKPGDEFRPQTEVLAVDLRARVNGHAGDVSARPRQARDGPGSDRVRHADHDDGNRRRRALCGGDAWIVDGDDRVHVQAHQFGGKIRQSLQPAVCLQALEVDVAALDVAEIAQPLV